MSLQSALAVSSAIAAAMVTPLAEAEGFHREGLGLLPHELKLMPVPEGAGDPE